MIGKIHSFESMATLDGDGVRFAVFMSNCPLRCCYCHNPDTWTSVNCIEMDEKMLVSKIKRYKPYFQSNGGVTFSGGEPLVQASYINAVGSLLKAEKISYILDTSGHIDLTDEVKNAVDNAEYVILDLKFWDCESYKKYVNGDFEKVMQFANYLNETCKKVWFRTVIVPNLNDTTECMDKYLSVLEKFSNIKKYELLAFHTMGFFKYDNLSIINPLENVSGLDLNVLSNLQNYVDVKMKE